LKVTQHAFFLPVEDGRCFCVERRPVDVHSGRAIMHLPAFGDEMNKSRAMTARAARAFAARGFTVIQIDLFGCGDSSGSIADATFDRWTDNLCAAIEWLEVERGTNVEWLWALRSGALLVSALLRQGRSASTSVMLWQPICKGEMQLTQLLRQKAASALVASRHDGAQLSSLRGKLRAGESLEIGGYTITSALAGDLERSRLDPSILAGRRVAWLEVDPSEEPSLSPATKQTVEKLKASGAQVTAEAVQGSAFWQSVEIERCDGLVEASVAALMREPVH
jgi:uncharacterized protein